MGRTVKLLAQRLLDEDFTVAGDDLAAIRSRLLTDIKPFRLDRFAVETVLECLPRILEDSGDLRWWGNVRTPTDNTWIEWLEPQTGCQVAVHFRAGNACDGPSLKSGNFSVLIDRGREVWSGGGFYDFEDANALPWGFIGPADSRVWWRDDVEMQRRAAAAGVSFGFFLTAAFTEICFKAVVAMTLINSPRIVRWRDTAAPKFINAKRARRGKFPLLAWREVVIDLGGKGRVHDAVVGHETGSMPLHYVRLYFKPTLGIWIWPHWRGDAENGVAKARYRVTDSRRAA